MIGGSIYATAGTSVAASTTRSSKASAAPVVNVVARVVNKDGKTIRTERGVAKLVGSGPATGQSADTPAGPSTECMDYYDYNAGSVGAGGYAEVTFPFSVAPFVEGDMFNETTQIRALDVTQYQSGDTVVVSAFNNWTASQPIAGYFGVLYENINGVC